LIDAPQIKQNVPVFPLLLLLLLLLTPLLLVILSRGGVVCGAPTKNVEVLLQ
jgi:hypothetical protein